MDGLNGTNGTNGTNSTNDTNTTSGINGTNGINGINGINGGVDAHSQGPNLEALDSTSHRSSLVAQEPVNPPFWSAARVGGLENPPPYTAGPSRVILANDGTKDCLAVLLTPDLVAALNKASRDKIALAREERELEEFDTRIYAFSCNLQHVEETIRNTRHHERTREMQQAHEELHMKRREAEEHRRQMSLGLAPLDSSLRLATSQFQGIMEDALLRARLMDIPEPRFPRTSPDTDADTSMGDYSDSPSEPPGLELTPHQRLLQNARIDLIDSRDTLMTHQARFDDRKADYVRKLVDFHKTGARRTESACIRLDHQHFQYVRTLTRNLMAAEQRFKAQKRRVRALEFPVDPASDDVAAPESNVIRESIDFWARRVLPDGDDDEGIWESIGPPDLDDWDARSVEIMDSYSAVDLEDFADELDDWKAHCRGLREKEKRKATEEDKKPAEKEKEKPTEEEEPTGL